MSRRVLVSLVIAACTTLTPPAFPHGAASVRCSSDEAILACADAASGRAAPALTAALAQRLADPRFEGAQLGVSVWVDGFGEVFSHEPDLPLLPASNQKLLTAVGALELLPHERRLATTVTAAGLIVDGTVRGNLVLRGGGDPTLTRRGSHSLDALAVAVARAGVRSIDGDLVVDESRHDRARSAPGWQDWHVPAYAGPLSALMVDDNRGRTDAAFLTEPALAHGASFRDALADNGVVVHGDVVLGRASRAGAQLALQSSPAVVDLVAEMLLRSDNEIAEQLVREIGLAAAGEGSTPAGTHAISDVVAGWCATIGGRSADGSGLSRGNRHTARELRLVVQHARRRPWWPALQRGLPVAGETGTLAGRFSETAAAGNLRAKTGTIIGGRALTGELTTAGGRRAVFSILVNGEAADGSLGAIDAFVATLAADRS